MKNKLLKYSIVVIILIVVEISEHPIGNLIYSFNQDDPKKVKLLINQLKGGDCLWAKNGKAVLITAHKGYCEESAAFLLGQGGSKNRFAVVELIEALSPSDNTTNNEIAQAILNILGTDQFTPAELRSFTQQRINSIARLPDYFPSGKELLIKISEGKKL